MFQQTWKSTIVVLLAVALIGSVFAGLAYGQQSQNTTYLRVAHASPDAPAVDVYLNNGSTVDSISNVSYGNVSDYQEIEAGTYNVTITAAGDSDTVVFSDDVTFDSKMATTLAATGEADDDFEPVAYSDDGLDPGSNYSAVRIVHLSPDGPSVDVTVENDTVLADTIEFQEASEYVNVPAGEHTLEIRLEDEDNNGSVISTVDVSLEEESVYSVMVIGYTNGDSDERELEALIEEDSKTTIEIPVSDTNETADTNETDE